MNTEKISAINAAKDLSSYLSK